MVRWRVAFWGMLTQMGACFGGCYDGDCSLPLDATDASNDAAGGLVPNGGSGGFAFGGGGTGGPDVLPPPTRLGRACATDAECGDGLTCIKADSGLFDGEGPAKGMCTVECAGSAEFCEQFRGANDPIPRCISMQSGSSFCFQGCDPDAGQFQFDSNKCHGRTELACAAIPDPAGGAWPVCVPQCNVDSD